MANILHAVLNLVEVKKTNLKVHYISKNRANSMGEALEEYVKDLFAGTFDLNSSARSQRFSEIFSWGGNQNNPPDFILKGADAVEVKKIEVKKSDGQLTDLALNSSPPKSKLRSSDFRVLPACKQCETEKWTEKDILYVVGNVSNNELISLTMVYGEDYAASPQVYEKIAEMIHSGVMSIPDVEFEETKELARVNRVDPLGITYLRVRGMWGIKHPLRVFSDVYSQETGAKFNFMCIINKEKYLSFPTEDRKRLEQLTNNVKELSIKDIKVKVPDNPVQLREAKLISFYIREK